MKIIYIHQHYRTPDGWGSTRPYHFTNALQEAGHQVTLLCAWNGVNDKVEFQDKIKIVFFAIPYQQSFGFYKRISSFLSFTWKCWRYVRKNEKPDLLYISSTPLFTGIVGVLAKKFKGIKYYFEVRDLWPQVPIALNIIPNKWMQKLSYYLADTIYKNADKVIVLSQGMFDEVSKSIQPKKIHTINNFSDSSLFTFIDEPTTLPLQTIQIVYFGAVGMANGLDSLILMAEYTHNHQLDFHFTIIGDGADLSRLKSITKDKQLTNITFTPPIQKNELNKYLDKFHFSLISYADVEILDTSSPNKFYDSLAKGLIPILTTHGWMKNFIDRNVCGVVMDRNDIKKTINEIQMIADNPILLKNYRNNCKKLYDLCFTKEIAIQKLMELIEA